MILKSTSAYELDQISYKSNSDSLTVWSNNIPGGSFIATNIIQLFTHPFSSYIDYNIEEKRCELKIF